MNVKRFLAGLGLGFFGFVLVTQYQNCSGFDATHLGSAESRQSSSGGDGDNNPNSDGSDSGRNPSDGGSSYVCVGGPPAAFSTDLGLVFPQFQSQDLNVGYNTVGGSAQGVTMGFVAMNSCIPDTGDENRPGSCLNIEPIGNLPPMPELPCVHQPSVLLTFGIVCLGQRGHVQCPFRTGDVVDMASVPFTVGFDFRADQCDDRTSATYMASIIPQDRAGRVVIEQFDGPEAWGGQFRFRLEGVQLVGISTSGDRAGYTDQRVTVNGRFSAKIKYLPPICSVNN